MLWCLLLLTTKSRASSVPKSTRHPPQCKEHPRHLPNWPGSEPTPIWLAVPKPQRNYQLKSCRQVESLDQRVQPKYFTCHQSFPQTKNQTPVVFVAMAGRVLGTAVPTCNQHVSRLLCNLVNLTHFSSFYCNSKSIYTSGDGASYAISLLHMHLWNSEKNCATYLKDSCVFSTTPGTEE